MSEEITTDTTSADATAETIDSVSPAEMPATTPERHQIDLDRARQLRSENKAMRDRAKSAEAQVASLTERVAGYQRTEVEHAAGQLLENPGDLFTGGATLADFLDEDGAVDLDAVTATAQDLVTERPHWAKGYQGNRPPSNRPIETLKGGATDPNYDNRPSVSWGGLLASARKNDGERGAF